MEKTLEQSRIGGELRRLTAADFDEAVSIDTAVTGRTRRSYFDRRLKAALRASSDHVQFAATGSGQLDGYVLARRMLGEFGRLEPGLRLETIAVRPGVQGQGIGLRLLGALEAWALKHGVVQIRTTAEWRNHAMLGFLDRAGFQIARSQIIDCAVQAGRLDGLERGGEDEPDDPPRAAKETDYGSPGAPDFEALARDRTEVHSLVPGDLAGVLAIDRRVSGHARDAYLAGLFDEALNDSAIRVSLVARRGMTVGFVMARTDFGDFGRPAPSAVIDTIGVHPDFAGTGVGTALLSQLFANLHALQIERVETVVGPENPGLQGFFHKAGFAPAQRLSFVKPLSP